jgi:mannose-6-phosphate isomerase
MRSGPVRLEPSFREKIWGSTVLAPWFPDRDRRIGEVWFPAEEILVKFIFTTARLSVQVHPPGKTEMWHILRAGPGAGIALGFRRPITAERLRAAALSGEIEQLLKWFPVSAGDTFFTPPGTVHAIGGDIAFCEIQQNYPVTYRLYDYGRGRELHLDKAVEVARLGPHPGKSTPEELPEGGQLLASCRHFVTEALLYTAPVDCQPDSERYHLLIVTEGKGSIAGEPFAAGQLWRVPASGQPFLLAPDGAVKMLRTYLPQG